MKIIFSRKGFDSQFGKQPSPVLPDGTLLSLPIPRKNDITTFGNLFYGSKSYFDIITELKPNTTIKADDTCHLDPDIRMNISSPHPQDRNAIFGQCDAALTLLKKFDIKEEDIFLFFGWFKETEYQNGRLRYKKNVPDLHIIYGYLQVGEVYRCDEKVPSYARHHAHMHGSFTDVKNNAVYIAGKTFSLQNSLPGSGCFTYHPNLVLTAAGMTRSKWKPHSFFKQAMTYHHPTSFRETHFQSAAQGQEFIMEGSDELIDWVTKLVAENREDNMIDSSLTGN